MTANTEKLFETFASALGIERERVSMELEYNSITEWDSIAHMVLIAQIEEAFDVMLDTDEIIDMSSPKKAVEILSAHQVSFD